MAGRRTSSTAHRTSTSTASTSPRELNTQSSVNVAAWAEDAAVAVSVETGVDPAPTLTTVSSHRLPLRPSATVTQRDPIRGTTVTLSIPLDEPPASATRAVRPSDPVNGDGTSYVGEGGVAQPQQERPSAPRKKILRRDSMERREALLKGKEGSRRRQRWENGQLLSNPWAEPPLPQDWEVRPTHPRTVVPYFLAPLWEADSHSRARRQSKAAKAKAQATIESRSHVLPRELREKLKRTKSARGLLMDLENQVRRFLEDYHHRQQTSLDTLAEDAEEFGQDEGAIASSSDEDDEVVFVGRHGQMKDVPPSPKTSSPRKKSRPGTSGSSSSGDLVEIETDTGLVSFKREMLVVDGPEGDPAASFARWIVHSIGDYYGLKTWSVTVGDPARREAYVGIGEGGDAAMKAGRGVGTVARPILPQPLWGMV